MVNQPEITENVKAALFEAGHASTKILIYIHYLPILDLKEGEIIIDPSLDDCQFGPSILSRILEGCNRADRILIHSQWGADLLIKLARQRNMELAKQKISIVPPPGDAILFQTDKNWEMPSDNLVSYPNRPYAHYGTAELFKVLNRCQRNFPFKVYLSDILAKQSSSRRLLDSTSARVRSELENYPFIVWGNDDDRKRSNYLQKICDSRIVLAPNRSAALWSMSIVDGMASGRPALAPNAGGFRDLLPPDLLWNNERDFKDKFLCLLKEPDTWEHYAKLCHSAVQYLNPLNIGQKLEECFYAV